MNNMDYIGTHSNWALVVIILMLIAIINAAISFFRNKKYNFLDRKLTLYALISVHIQILLGAVTYMQSHFTQTAMADFGAAMKDSMLRLFAVEHPLMMIIGVVVITIGYTKAKKATDNKLKFKNIFIYYTIGLILILSRIPWSHWGQH